MLNYCNMKTYRMIN